MKPLQTTLLLALTLPLAAFAKHHEKPHWSYEGDHGPEHWGELHPEWAVAKNGQQQSPVDIDTRETLETTLPPIEFHYKSTPLAILNNGHTIQVNYQEGSYIVVGGERWDLLQFHFHAPSEHTYNSQHQSMEVHFVHKNARGELAVVGVFLIDSKENEFIRTLWANAPKEKGPAKVIQGIDINGAALIPAVTGYFKYPGSLTTPPCTEAVSWHVMQKGMTVSQEQTDAFIDLVGKNARPVQPLNGRVIKASK